MAIEVYETILGEIFESTIEWESQFDDAAELIKKADEIFRRPDEFLPTKPHEVELEKAVKASPEFTDPKKLAKVRPRVKIMGAWAGRVVFFAFAEAAACIAVGYLAQAVRRKFDETEVDSIDRPRRRRRKKTQICLDECFDIVKKAREEVGKGWAANRALETEDIAQRNRRKFPSRQS